jgi:hypothetical protein
VISAPAQEDPAVRTLVQRFLPPLVALFFAVAPLAAQEANRNVRFALPGPAKADPESRESYVIARPQCVLSYHADKKIPNRVCRELRESDIGDAPCLGQRSRSG